MKILLTGADGFLGSHILRRLIEEGHTVRAFLQESRDHSTIKGLEYEAYYGDLLDEADMDAALTGCDAVIHTVAITDIWPSRNKFMWKINLDTVMKLSELVLRHGTKRFIYIGTANSFGYGTKDIPGDEKSPYNCGKYGLDYMDSKKAAQDFLLQEYIDKNLPVIILNPSFMIGEYDTKPGSGAMVLAVLKGRMPAYSEGGRCFTYAGDVAAAAVGALKMGRPGECYITGGTNMTYREFFNLTASLSGVAPPKRKFPYFMTYASCCIMEAISRITNRPPLVSRAMVRISRHRHFYSSDKATRELGMPHTDIKTAVDRSIKWFRENGYC